MVSTVSACRHVDCIRSRQREGRNIIDEPIKVQNSELSQAFGGRTVRPSAMRLVEIAIPPQVLPFCGLAGDE